MRMRVYPKCAMGSRRRTSDVLNCCCCFSENYSPSDRDPSPRKEEEETERLAVVPKDVKEGHFAVVAISDGEAKRFVVSLSCLSHPKFLRLLEQAEEEFGFQQKGALAIPCYSGELEKILREI